MSCLALHCFMWVSSRHALSFDFFVLFCLVACRLVMPFLVLSCLVLPCRVLSYLVLICMYSSYPVLPSFLVLIWHSLLLSCFLLSCHVSCCLVLPYLVIFCRDLSCRIMSHRAVSFVFFSFFSCLSSSSFEFTPITQDFRSSVVVPIESHRKGDISSNAWYEETLSMKQGQTRHDILKASHSYDKTRETTGIDKTRLDS